MKEVARESTKHRGLYTQKDRVAEKYSALKGKSLTDGGIKGIHQREYSPLHIRLYDKRLHCPVMRDLVMLFLLLRISEFEL